jgi:hypothetical protein
MIVWIVLGCMVLVTACSGVSDEDVWQDELALGERWRLPGDVRAVGAGVRLQYDAAPAWNGTQGCSGRLQNGSRTLGEHLRMKFPAVRSIGGYACRRNTANTSRMSVHGTGRALDIFIPTRGRAADAAAGDPVANWLVTHASQMGIQLIIWNRSVWRANGSNESAYSGPHPHHDHLHVELTEASARAISIPTDDGTMPDAGMNDGFADAGPANDASTADAGESLEDAGPGETPADAGSVPAPDDDAGIPDLPEEQVDAGAAEPPPDTGWEVPEGEEPGEEDSLGKVDSEDDFDEERFKPRAPRSSGTNADDAGLDFESSGCRAAPSRGATGDAALWLLAFCAVVLRPRRRGRGR